MEVSLKEIYQAYKKCQQGKAKSVNAQKYSANLLDNMIDTQLALQAKDYQPQAYTCFVAINGSKPREIFAANFYDRVVHHYLVPKLEKIINHKFIYHSCANQKGKGTHFGVNALQKMMRQNKTKQTHFLQLDIHNFFYSIDKNILLTILANHLKIAIKNRQIHNEQTIDYYKLCTQILQKVMQVNYLDKNQLSMIPAHKQLKNIAIGKGLPIGNLTPQFFGNVYMNELDQFVKHQLKVKQYVRFVDDFVLLGNKTQLQAWQGSIEVFLKTKLQLTLKPEIILKPINQGVDFLGYIIYPHYKLVRKRVIANFYQKLNKWHKQCTKSLNKGVLFVLTKEDTSQINSLFASYLGHLKHAKHHKVLAEKINQFPWLMHLFYQVNDKYLSKTYNKFATKFCHQQAFFNHYFQDFVLILQKGRGFIVNANQQQTHIKYLTNYLNQLQDNAQNYLFVSEQSFVHNRLKQRKLKQLFIANH